MSDRFRRSTSGGFPVIALDGRIGTGDLAALEDIAAHLEVEAEDCVVFDLTDCSYITSRGFGVFIQLHRTFDASGRHLFLAVSEEARELFRVLRLHTRLHLHATVTDCVAAARAARGMLR